MLALAAAQAAAGEAVLRPDARGDLVAEARIGGRAVTVRIEPAYPQVLVPAAAARRLGVPFDRRAGQRETVRGRDVLAFPTVLDEVRLGDAAVTRVPALVVDDRRVRGVVLGRPFLARAESVSWRHGVLTVTTAEAAH